MAQRADGTCQAARKRLVLADTILFAEQKEPKAKVDEGTKIKTLVIAAAMTKLQRPMPAEANRRIVTYTVQL